MPSSPRFELLSSSFHWPDPERWSPYASRASWCTGNACSAAALSHRQLTKLSANLATAGPLCCHDLCCLLFSQWVIFPLRLGKYLNWGQKKVFSRFCLGNYVYIQDFQLLKDSLEQDWPARDNWGDTRVTRGTKAVVGRDRQIKILFIYSFRHHLQL